MKNSPKSKYLLISITLFVLSLTILSMFMLALSLPYTERPLHNFPITTPTPTPPEFTMNRVPTALSNFIRHFGENELSESSTLSSSDGTREEKEVSL
jgi:hypothetical protein